VNAVAPGYTASSPAEVRVVEDETTTVELPLGRGAVVRGRVTDEQGAPIAGADVMILDADFARVRAQRTTHVGPATAETAEDGSFTVSGVEPGDAQLSVRKQGYVAIRKAIQADGETSVDVQLSRGLSLSGIVTRGGKPVAGATVGASTPAVGGEHQPAVTDDDGRFTLTGLVAGRYTVSAFFEESHADVRDVDPSRQKDVAISLDPQAKGTVYGTVTGIPPSPGRGGKYVRRVVMVNSEDGSAEGPIDEAGSYRIEYAPTGSVYVTALIESSAGIARSSSRKQVEVIVGQPLRVDLELGGNVRVSGRITIDGKPVAGATVGFMSEDGMMGSAQSRDDGMYEMFLPAPGRYHVYARSDELNERHYQAVRDIRGGETIDIDLHEQVLEGTVVDAVTRRPIAGALVTLTPAAGALMSIAAEVPSDANGRFRIATAAAGATRLIASAAGYAIRTLPVTGTTSQYTFELTPAPDLRVRVLDARTNAPLEAHVIVSDADGFIDGRPRRSADGATYLFSLAPGQYRVMAIVQGYAAKTVEVTAPGEVDIEVQ
jgi:uncharacterized surface anchored protein